MNDKKEHALEHIVYVSIPETFKRTVGTFQIDPSILLPVELPAGVQGLDPQDLSWEMILSGMLKIIAWDPEHANISYFRDFILAVRPEIITELTQAGIAKASAHDHDLSEEIFRALVGLQPANPRSVLNLALLYDQRAKTWSELGRQDFTEENENLASQWYKNALSLDEVLPETHLYAGHFWLRVSDIKRAIGQFKAYVQIASDSDLKTRVKKILLDLERHDLSDSQFKLAFDCIRSGREQEGLDAINEFLHDHPDVWNAHFMQGWALRRLERFTEGIEAFRKAITLGGDNADTLNELAICLMEVGQFPESRRALEEALRREPENMKIISNLGILALKCGDQEEARGFFLAALAEDPQDSIAADYLKLLDNQA